MISKFASSLAILCLLLTGAVALAQGNLAQEYQARRNANVDEQRRRQCLTRLDAQHEALRGGVQAAIAQAMASNVVQHSPGTYGEIYKFENGVMCEIMITDAQGMNAQGQRFFEIGFAFYNCFNSASENVTSPAYSSIRAVQICSAQ